MLNIIRPSYSESMQGILSQLQPSWGNEYGHSGVQYDAFSMMYSSCLLLLNLRRKGLKPNTSVKSMNHPLFISFNWKKEGEKKTVPRRWDVWSLSFFYYDQMKKKNTKVSLFIHPPLSVALGGPDWRRNLIRNGQKSERDTLHHSEVPRFSEMPHSSPFFSLQCPPLSLFPTFPVPPLASISPLCPPPSPPIFTILPSTPAPSSPDTRHSAASQVSPFSSTASLLWWCCSAVVLTAHSFPCFPHSDLCSALGPQRNGSLPCLLTFCCVCASGRVCG